MMESKSYKDRFEAVLPLVEKPSRYLGNEVNSCRKNLDAVKLKVALAFPETYEIAMSHLGIKLLYEIINKRPEVAAERVFAPWVDMESLMRKWGIPLLSLESRRPVKDFDIFGFSLQYELTYSNVLNMLELAGVPLLARDRKEGRHPLIIGGGPCALNPEPLADFFDAFVIGDGEEVILEIIDTVLECKEHRRSREELLWRLSKLEGLYIPAYYDAVYDERGRLKKIVPNREGVENPRRRIVADLNRVDHPEEHMVPFSKIVHDRISVEIARGCTKGCRFCQAGFIHRPLRERDPEKIKEIVAKSARETGYEEISLLSLSTGDYSCIESLVGDLMSLYSREKIAVSFPSLRIGTLTRGLIEQIKRVRKTGITIAPEAGTQRLRDAINKDISEEEILQTSRVVFEEGWQGLKLYFMVGLPSESQEDLEGIVRLAQKVLSMGRHKRSSRKVSCSISTFVPKPHTPFQWEPQLSLEKSIECHRYLRRQLRKRGLNVKWQDPKLSLLEGIFSRGDRRLGRVLQKAHELGCRFDGWSDQFRFDLWRQAFEHCGMDMEALATTRRGFADPLPWDHIESGISKTFLADEAMKAHAGLLTEDCRFKGCQGCGVCDGTTINPKICTPKEEPLPFPGFRTYVEAPRRLRARPCFRRLRIRYAKLQEARFLSHLELYSTFLRSMRRAGIPMRFSQGYHPLPKIHFGPALPIGIESEAEYLDIECTGYIPETSMISRLNEELPKGLKVLACHEVPSKTPSLFTDITGFTYRVELNQHGAERLQQLIERFMAQDNIEYLKKTKDVERRINLRPFVRDMVLKDDCILELNLGFNQKGAVKPTEVLQVLLNMTESEVRCLRVLKTAAQFRAVSGGEDRVD